MWKRNPTNNTTTRLEATIQNNIKYKEERESSQTKAS